MTPKKPMNSKQIENYINSLCMANSILQQENAELKEDLKVFQNERSIIKSNKILIDFVKMKKADLLSLSAAEKSLQVFKVLKALCFSQLKD